jgi:hypothetical protein
MHARRKAERQSPKGSKKKSLSFAYLMPTSFRFYTKGQEFHGNPF